MTRQRKHYGRPPHFRWTSLDDWNGSRKHPGYRGEKWPNALGRPRCACEDGGEEYARAQSTSSPS